MKPYKLGAVALAAALLAAPSVPARAVALARPLPVVRQDQDTPSDVEQALFTRGQKLYNDGHYEQAAGVLNDFLKTYPNSIITDLTLLWLGRTYIALGRLQDAEQVGQRLRTIKDTPFVDIYDGELQAARTELAARGGAPPPVSPVRAGQQSRPAPVRVTPTPAPTPVQVASRPRSTPRPMPTPATQTPTFDNTQTAQTNVPTRRPFRRGGSRRGNVPVTSPAGQGPQASATLTPPVMRPTPAPPLVRPTPTPTPRRLPPPVQVAVSTPTPAPVLRNDANEGTLTTAPPPLTSAPASSGETGFQLTVKQVPNLALALRRATVGASPGQVVQVPLTISNAGNKEDQFRLETDLPAEYQPTFSLAAGGQDTGLPILVTPQLARGQSLDVFLNLRVPETAADAQQRRFIVRAASQADYQVFKVADAALTVVAAALAGSSGVSRESVQPGETFTQTISVRNQGSAAARNARADFVFNPDFELVNANPSPLVYERASRTAIWSLGDVDPNSSRDISVTLRAVPDALAANRPLGRGTMRTASLPTAANFDGPSIAVGRVPKAQIEAVSTGLTATPGDSIYVPFIVRNPGNYAESYELRVTAPGAPGGTLYADTNGDGQHQDAEPVVSQTTALDPRGGQYPLLLRVDIPRATPDRQQYAYNLVARALSAARVASEANSVLTVAAPRVRVRAEQGVAEGNPGDQLFYRLVLVNEGGGLAKSLVVTELLPEALEFVSSDPSLNTQDAPGSTRRITWRVPELAPGDTAVLRVTVRLASNLAADANIRTVHTLTYQDGNGNTYTQGQ